MSSIKAGHAVPPILLATFAWRFDSLVADPVPAMGLLLIVTAAGQLAAALTSLPAAGSTKPQRKPRPGEKKRSEAGPNIAVVRSPMRFPSTSSARR